MTEDQIQANKPDGATHYKLFDGEPAYLRDDNGYWWRFKDGMWIECHLHGLFTGQVKSGLIKPL